MKIREQLFRIQFLSLIYLNVFFRIIKNVNNIFADKTSFRIYSGKFFQICGALCGHKDSVGVNLDVSHQTSDDRVGYFSLAYDVSVLKKLLVIERVR